MTHPMDFFAILNRKVFLISFSSSDYFGQEGGRGLHTQESGDAGFSSNMDHKFSDDYSESALPVAEKGISFVIPIPKEEPGIPGKTWSHPSVFGHAAGPKSHPMSADEGVIKLSTVHVTPPALSEENPREETVMVLPGTADITEMQLCKTMAVYIPALPEKSPREETVMVLPGTADITEIDVKVQEHESPLKMNTGEKPVKQKHPPLEGRNCSHHKKRAVGKYQKLHLLCWMVFICVPVSEGLPVSAIGAQAAAVQKLKCFTCMDEERCPKLMKIFDSNLDTALYQKDLNETFPRCLGISPPGPESCAVCRESKVTILCSEDVGRMDVEDSDGKRIENISPTCVQQQLPGSTCVGLIPSVEFFLIVVLGVLVL